MEDLLNLALFVVAAVGVAILVCAFVTLEELRERKAIERHVKARRTTEVLSVKTSEVSERVEIVGGAYSSLFWRGAPIPYFLPLIPPPSVTANRAVVRTGLECLVTFVEYPEIRATIRSSTRIKPGDSLSVTVLRCHESGDVFCITG